MAKKIDGEELLRNLDLDAIRNDIADKERELTEMIADKQKAIDALRTLEKAADVFLNGKKPRKQRESKRPRNESRPQQSQHAQPGGAEQPQRRWAES